MLAKRTHGFKRSGCRPKLSNDRGPYLAKSLTTLRAFFTYCHNPVSVWIRERAKRRCINDTKHRRHRGNAEGEGRDSQQHHPALPQDGAPCHVKVLAHSRERHLHILTTFDPVVRPLADGVQGAALYASSRRVPSSRSTVYSRHAVAASGRRSGEAGSTMRPAFSREGRPLRQSESVSEVRMCGGVNWAWASYSYLQPLPHARPVGYRDSRLVGAVTQSGAIVEPQCSAAAAHVAPPFDAPVAVAAPVALP